MNPQAEQFLLQQVRTECGYAQRFVGGMNREEFIADIKTQRAVTMTFVILAELADRLQLNDPSFAQRFANLPLVEIRGMRNRIAHGYFYVDQSVIWDTVTTSIPALVALLDEHNGS